MTNKKTKGPRIEVVEFATQEVIHVIPLSNTSERHVERVLMGLLRNMDTDKFFAREVLS